MTPSCQTCLDSGEALNCAISDVAHGARLGRLAGRPQFSGNACDTLIRQAPSGWRRRTSSPFPCWSPAPCHPLRSWVLAELISVVPPPAAVVEPQAATQLTAATRARARTPPRRTMREFLGQRRRWRHPGPVGSARRNPDARHAAPRNHAALRDLSVEPIDNRQDVSEQVRGLAPNGVDAVFDYLGLESSGLPSRCWRPAVPAC